ncbi:hypothetical protein CEXT_102331 [Caerostris extrusa]|uniref:Uncharacterized protein n=1 Tax=Caerostris extrusa TaxID=172846 RepID=A0AAV4N4Z8_CAEEX|nr:hypothetical protein CEXT_102331 [Caerostris extrusa]
MNFVWPPVMRRRHRKGNSLERRIVCVNSLGCIKANKMGPGFIYLNVVHTGHHPCRGGCGSGFILILDFALLPPVNHKRNHLESLNYRPFIKEPEYAKNLTVNVGSLELS